MQRYRLRGVTTAEQPHGKSARCPKDHITLSLEQVGSHGTALLVELPEYVSGNSRVQAQLERARAVWSILRPIAHRKTYVDVYPVSADVVNLEVWSTSYEGAADLGDGFSFHARIEYVKLAWPCVQRPTHSLEAVPFVESRYNHLMNDEPLAPRLNVWHNAAD